MARLASRLELQKNSPSLQLADLFIGDEGNFVQNIV